MIKYFTIIIYLLLFLYFIMIMLMNLRSLINKYGYDVYDFMLKTEKSNDFQFSFCFIAVFNFICNFIKQVFILKCLQTSVQCLIVLKVTMVPVNMFFRRTTPRLPCGFTELEILNLKHCPNITENVSNLLQTFL